jgi:hypothetical protein
MARGRSWCALRGGRRYRQWRQCFPSAPSRGFRARRCAAPRNDGWRLAMAGVVARRWRARTAGRTGRQHCGPIRAWLAPGAAHRTEADAAGSPHYVPYPCIPVCAVCLARHSGAGRRPEPGTHDQEIGAASAPSAALTGYRHSKPKRPGLARVPCRRKTWMVGTSPTMTDEAAQLVWMTRSRVSPRAPRSGMTGRQRIGVLGCGSAGRGTGQTSDRPPHASTSPPRRLAAFPRLHTREIAIPRTSAML